MSDSKSKLRDALEREARALGFAAIGVAPADAAPKSGERLREWLASGAHGDMIWMEEKADRARLADRALARGPLGDRAGHELRARDRSAGARRARAKSGRISVYAQGGDYHDVGQEGAEGARALAGRRGRQGRTGETELKVFVDTAPVMEKPLAEAAGLGWQGKHTNLVSRTDG